MSTPILKAHREKLHSHKFSAEAQKQAMQQEYLGGFKTN